MVLLPDLNCPSAFATLMFSPCLPDRVGENTWYFCVTHYTILSNDTVFRNHSNILEPSNILFPNFQLSPEFSHHRLSRTTVAHLFHTHFSICTPPWPLYQE